MKIYKLVIGIVVGFLFGFGACFHMNPQTIDIEDYQLLNQDMVDRLKAESCAKEVNEVRKELDDKFKLAWKEKEGTWKNFETCDNQPLVIESNVIELCDTTEKDEYIVELEDTLEECVDANDSLSTQVYNFMYEDR